MRKLVLVALLVFFFVLPVLFTGVSDADILGIKILGSGDNHIHGSKYVSGYLWYATMTNPTRIFKMDIDTLEYERVILSSGLGGGYDLEYAENYIWVITSDNSKLVKVNPNNLSDWSVAITFSSFSEPQSLVYAYGQLWVGGYNKIANVSLSTLAYNLTDYSGVVTAQIFHAITNGGNSIYATTDNGGYVLKIDPTNTSNYNSTSIGSYTISDDITYYNNHLYVGIESSASRIYKFDGSNISDYTYEEIGISSCYGVSSSEGYIWATYVGSPGVVRQISESLTVVSTFTLPSGYNNANEILFDDNATQYITCWMMPARIVKYLFPYTYVYNYIVHGPYYENGDVASVLVALTLEFENTYPQQYELNGSDGIADTLNITSIARGVVFTWNFTEVANYTRVYYLTDETFEEIWIFIPNTTSESVYLYTFDLNNFAGVGSPYMETIINVAGQNCIVERQSAQVVSSIPFYMVYGRRYTLELISDEGSYTWGDYVALSDTDITLTVRGVDFPKSTLYKFKYVRVYGLRAFDVPYGNITIIYEDLLNMTSSVTIYIDYVDGTNVYNTTETQDSFVHEWLSALNNTDYSVRIVIDHERYGTYEWKQLFTRTNTVNPFDSLRFLGTLDFDVAILFGAVIIVVSGGAFSVLNPEVGAFVACAVATFLTWWGWIPIPLPLLVAAWVLSFLFALAMAKRRVVR